MLLHTFYTERYIYIEQEVCCFLLLSLDLKLFYVIYIFFLVRGLGSSISLIILRMNGNR